MSASPFASPATPEGISWQELNGSLLLFEVHGLETGISTSLGEKDAVRADVHVLDGAQQEHNYVDALVFPRALISQLRSRAGQMVLGRLGQGTARPGQNPPWLLSDATPEDHQVATQWLAQRQQPAAPAPAQTQPQPQVQPQAQPTAQQQWGQPAVGQQVPF